MTFNMINNAIDIHEYDAHDVMSQLQSWILWMVYAISLLVKKKREMCDILYSANISYNSIVNDSAVTFGME